MGHSTSPDSPSLSYADGVRYPLAVGAVCGCEGPHSPLCAGPCMHYALWGAQCSLAPSLVLWSVVCSARFLNLRHLVAVIAWNLSLCLSGVSRGPALVHRPSTGQAALGAPVCFPVVLMPFPTGGFCPKIYWAAARGT